MTWMRGARRHWPEDIWDTAMAVLSCRKTANRGGGRSVRVGSRTASGTATVRMAAGCGLHTPLSGHRQNHAGRRGWGPCRASPSRAGRLCPGSLDTNTLLTARTGAPGVVAAPDGAPEPPPTTATAGSGKYNTVRHGQHFRKHPRSAPQPRGLGDRGTQRVTYPWASSSP